VLLDLKKYDNKAFTVKLRGSILLHKKSALVWIGFFAAAIAYGFAAPIDYAHEKTVKIALIQSNSDPWFG